MSSPTIPPAAPGHPPGHSPGDSDPSSPSVPGAALWSDSDAGDRPPATGIEGLIATDVDRAMPTIGHIGRYALKYQLGSGGLGTVFAAHDPLLSRLIAVKTLKVEIKDDERESFNTLFINEARAAGGLSHPHIVTVFDAGISDNRAYIAMELLKGRDLRQLRQEGWRATPAQAALIVRRVADALAFAHSKGVIHRDIKPANIFMVGRTQPRVLDFGIARVAHQGSGDAMLGAGSPYYMAPEQVRREPTDRRVDVFSLGVVLYELLTDQKPFRGETLKEITTAVLMHEPELASKVDQNVPKALAEIAARAMAKDPEQRFRSARSLARELRQWLDDNPIGPDPDSAQLAGTSSRKSAPAFVATAFVAVGLLAGGLWWQNSTEALAAQGAGSPAHAVHADVVVPPPAPVLAAPIVSAAASGSGTEAAAPAVPTATAAPESSLLQPSSSNRPLTATVVTAAQSTTPLTREDSLLLATIVPTTTLLAPAALPLATKKPEARNQPVVGSASPVVGSASPIVGSSIADRRYAVVDPGGTTIADSDAGTRQGDGPRAPVARSSRARHARARRQARQRRGGAADRHGQDRDQPLGSRRGRRLGHRRSAAADRADPGRRQAPDRRPQRRLHALHRLRQRHRRAGHRTSL